MDVKRFFWALLSKSDEMLNEGTRYSFFDRRFEKKEENICTGLLTLDMTDFHFIGYLRKNSFFHKISII